MDGKTCVFGIDYGTQGARAALVRVCDGKILGTAGRSYASGVVQDAMPGGRPLPEHTALAVPGDYLAVLPELVSECLETSGVEAKDVAGIGVDATTCTLLPVDEAGEPLAEQERFRENPHAYMKLWKHHGPVVQTRRLEELARKKQMRFIRCCGGHLSCEWAVPKIMEIREEDEALYRETAYFVELADWVNWKLCGTGQRMHRSAALAGLKSFWSKSEGYPPEAFFDELYPGFGEELRQKLWGEPDDLILPGSCAGRLCPDMARWLGLPDGIALSAGVADGHSSMMALGIHEAGTASLVIGTSNVMAFLDDELREIHGICGVVEDGIIPGFYGYDTGQSATGDMLGWFVDSCVPESYAQEARKRKMDIHELLCEKAEHAGPWKNTLTVLDWWNGNRNVLCDMNCRGQIAGLTLGTRPEDIYCAMLQSIACGTRVILKRCREYGVDIKKILVSGGIPQKNHLLVSQYANLLHMPVHLAEETQLPAKGAAVSAAAAAGLYDSFYAAMEHMKTKDFLVFEPQEEHAAAYEHIYQRYLHCHDYSYTHTQFFLDSFL